MKEEKQKPLTLLYLAQRDGLFCGICGATLEEEWMRYRLWQRAHQLGIRPPFKRTKVGLNIDHIIPRSIYKPWERGEHPFENLDNLQLAHSACNTQKANKLPLEQPGYGMLRKAGETAGTSSGP